MGCSRRAASTLRVNTWFPSLPWTPRGSRYPRCGRHEGKLRHAWAVSTRTQEQGRCGPELSGRHGGGDRTTHVPVLSALGPEVQGPVSPRGPRPAVETPSSPRVLTWPSPRVYVPLLRPPGVGPTLRTSPVGRPAPHTVTLRSGGEAPTRESGAQSAWGVSGAASSPALRRPCAGPCLRCLFPPSGPCGRPPVPGPWPPTQQGAGRLRGRTCAVLCHGLRVARPWPSAQKAPRARPGRPTGAGARLWAALRQERPGGQGHSAALGLVPDALQSCWVTWAPRLGDAAASASRPPVAVAQAGTRGDTGSPIQERAVVTVGEEAGEGAAPAGPCSPPDPSCPG